VLSRHLLRPGEEVIQRYRLRVDGHGLEPAFGPAFDVLMDQRKVESEDYHRSIEPDSATPEERAVFRQARAGLLWSKQFYHYIVGDWLHR